MSTQQFNPRVTAARGHHGSVVFPNLHLFVITCLDPRTDPAHFLGLGLSDAIVLRNVGGRVTPEVINHVAFIGQLAENVLPDGPLFEVAVIHHTQCGTGALADDTFRRRYAKRIGAEESTLREHAVLDPAATVTRDVERLRSAPAISPRVTVSGARLRRRHRPGADAHPRRPPRRSNRSITPITPRKPNTTRLVGRALKMPPSGDMRNPGMGLGTPSALRGGIGS